MKKFLSLVLALIMTMSLVTISAGATEYKDLTDKDEIQYEEAVAVLNRIGVITGYDDGSFRPETELTRGAAAKIIVSLLIGPEAASNLPNTYAPYPDVPANHTFAGVISYCKTAGIISGYGDGTFKPANSLTGYAFAKMLLGAVGYDSKIQGYTDTGWTMNVARDGNAAGLFNRIEFDGAAAVNREQACQLALNTLKATMVEYTGGLSITAGDAHVTSNPTLTYKISNQSYATNISNRKASNVGNANVDNHYTVEFGEEHFKDLRLNDEHGTKYSTDKDGGKTILNVARDDFGRPSNKWSFKKVTIGTFPIQPDYVYTERVIHRQDEKVTAAAKVRALELSGFNLRTDDIESKVIDTKLWVNGVEEPVVLEKVADIADWTDNGTTVEVYISEDDSDFIQDVVVIKTQLMEIKNIKSEAVSLKLYDDGSDNTSGDGIDGKEGVIGFNSRPLDKKVNDVEINDECYKTLSGMKVGDIVAVIPVAPEHENVEKFDVAEVYAPETVSGELTWVDTYGTEKSNATGIAVTVGGTDYDVALWNKDLTDIGGTEIRVTRKDVTLYLDEFGNALLAKNVGSTSDYMVIGGYHSGLVDGKVVTYADGWDIKGNEISLNIGNARYDLIGGDAQKDAAFPIGSLVHYSSSTTSKYAEWKLDELGVFDVASKRTNDAEPYTVKASNSRVVLNDYKTAAGGYNNDAFDMYTKDNDGKIGYDVALNDNVYVDDSGVKVIYLTMGDDNEVDTVEVKSGMQNISNKEILGTDSGFTRIPRAQACVGLKTIKETGKDGVTADSLVKAIVVKLESGSADLKDLVYVSRYLGSAGKAPGADNTQRPVYGYEVHFVGSDNWDDEVTIYSYQALDKGDFARARKPVSFPEGVKNVTEDNFYTLTEYVKTQKALSTMETGKIVYGDKVGFNIKGNKTLVELANYVPSNTNFSKDWPKDDLKNELDLGDEEIINILSLRGAKIIDLTRYEIQSTSELVDELKELNKKDLTFTVSALYNDDKDSDGFRDVHVLVITGTDTAPVHVDKDMIVVTTGIDGVAGTEKVRDGSDYTYTAPTGKVLDTVEVNGVAQTLTAGQKTFTVKAVTGMTVKITTKDAVVDPTPDEGHWEFRGDELVWVPAATPTPAAEVEEAAPQSDELTATSVQNAGPLAAYNNKYIRITNSAIPSMGEFTVFCTNDGASLKFGKDLTAADKAAMVKALNDSGLGARAFQPAVKGEATQEQIDAWNGTTTPVDPTDVPETVKPILTAPDGGVTGADKENRGTITFAKYKGEALTAEEKEAAIAAAIEKDANGQKPVSLTTQGAVVTAKFSDALSWKYTVKQDPSTKPSTNDGSAAYPTPLFKITLGDKSEYVATAGGTLKKLGAVKDTPYIWSEMSHCASTNDYVFTANKDGLVITADKLTADNYRKDNYDLTFVEAVQLSAASSVLGTSAGDILTTDAKVQVAGNSEKPVTTLADNDYMPKGATLVVKVKDVADKATASFQINGKTIVTSERNTTGATADVSMTIANVQPKEGTHDLLIEDATGYKISINGVLIEDGKLFKNGDVVNVPASAGVKEGDTLIGLLSANVGQKVFAADNDNVSVTVSSVGQQLTITAGNYTADNEIDGTLTLVSAYKLTANSGALVTNVREAEKVQPTHPNVVLTGSDNAYVVPAAPGESVTLYGDMKTVSNGKGFLATKEGSKIKVTEDVGDGVYKLEISGDAAPATDVTQGTLAASDDYTSGLALKAQIKSGTESSSIDLTVNGLSADAYVDATFVGTDSKVSEPTVALAGNKVTLTVTAVDATNDAPAQGAKLTTATVTVHDGSNKLELTFDVKNA